MEGTEDELFLRSETSLNSVDPTGAPKSKHSSNVAGGLCASPQLYMIIYISLHCGDCSGGPSYRSVA